MARLRDLGPVIRSFGVWAFVRRVWQQVQEDNIFVWASALAYAWLFAIFPFLIVLLGLLPYLPQYTRDHAENWTVRFTEQMLGKAGPAINENVNQLVHQHRHGWLGIGAVVTLWAASGGMSMTMQALDKCYDIKNGRSIYRQRLVAILLTIVIVSMVLLILILLPIGDAFEYVLYRNHLLPPAMAWGFDIARYALALVLMLAVLVIIYTYGPSVRPRFSLYSPGAVFSIVVWVLLNLGFKVYVDRFARFDQTYGTLGGAAILLLFFYVDSLVLLIGAEINSEIDFQMIGS